MCQNVVKTKTRVVGTHFYQTDELKTTMSLLRDWLTCGRG